MNDEKKKGLPTWQETIATIGKNRSIQLETLDKYQEMLQKAIDDIQRNVGSIEFGITDTETGLTRGELDITGEIGEKNAKARIAIEKDSSGKIVNLHISINEHQRKKSFSDKAYEAHFEGMPTKIDNFGWVDSEGQTVLGQLAVPLQPYSYIISDKRGWAGDLVSGESYKEVGDVQEILRAGVSKLQKIKPVK